MIYCLKGGPKFLFKMLPVKELEADFLHQQTQVLLDILRNAGAELVATICDGTNRFSRNSTVLNHGERVTIYLYFLILYTLLRTFEIIGLPKQCKNYHIH